MKDVKNRVIDDLWSDQAFVETTPLAEIIVPEEWEGTETDFLILRAILFQVFLDCLFLGPDWFVFVGRDAQHP